MKASWKPRLGCLGGVSILVALACQSPAHCPLLSDPDVSFLRGPSTIPEALGADARVGIDRVHTLGPVLAPVGHAVITVHLAELPTVAWETFTPGTQQSKAVPWAQSASRWPLLYLSTFLSPPQLTQAHQSLAPQLVSLGVHSLWSL